MHNWLEGILQEQLRNLWGIGRKKGKGNDEDGDDDDDAWIHSDVDESQSELDQPERNAPSRASSSFSARARFGPPSERSPSPEVSTLQDEDIEMDSGPSTPTAASFHTPQLFPEDDPEPGNDRHINIPLTNDMPQAHIAAIRRCIRDVSLPTWVGRPPVNLGEAKHGKLRANDYLVLFAFILPLVIPEFWHVPGSSEADRLQLQNFEDLVVCTNIVCSFKTSNADADLFTRRYKEYRRSKKRLFPFWRSKPNQHWAMHIADFLKYWGPLAALSEFPGERLIGLLQDVLTNKKIRKLHEKKLFTTTYTSKGDLDFTMIRQMSRRGKVKAALQDDDELKELGRVLEPPVVSVDAPRKDVSPTEESVFLKACSPFAREDYDAMLHYLRKKGRALHSVYDQTARDPNYTYLLPNVRKHTEVHIADRTYSIRQSHEGNSAIEFVHPETGSKDTGFIECIYSTLLKSKVHTFFIVRSHRQLPAFEERKAPFGNFNEKYCVRIMDELPSNNRVLIEQHHVVAHVSTLRRPAGTYGIERETLVVCRALNRGRR